MAGLSPFLAAAVALLAAMLAGHVGLSRTEGRGLAFSFLLAFSVQSGLLLVQFLQPGVLPGGLRAATGSTQPILLYLFFTRSRQPWVWSDGAHVLPFLFVLGLVLLPGSGWFIDAGLLTIELGYAIAILSIDRRDKENLWRRRGRQAVAGYLLVMAASDIWIAWGLARGTSMPWNTGLTGALLILVACVAAVLVAAWRDPEWLVRLSDAAKENVSLPSADPVAVADTEEDRRLCARLGELLENQRCYTEFGFGLDDAAKRLGVAPRQLSAAVNRVLGRGFRTLLNDYRVADVARQLADVALVEKTITDVMFDAGFQTKSNFHKEFAVRHAVSPSQYRKSQNGNENGSG